MADRKRKSWGTFKNELKAKRRQTGDGVGKKNEEAIVLEREELAVQRPGGRERLYCFPLFAHGQLITTSVTSHSNRSKLSLAGLVLCEEAIDVEQRKDKYWLLLTGYLVICSRCVRFIVYIVCL